MTKARITTGQMCPLKQLCAPRHGGRGGKNNGPGIWYQTFNMIYLKIIEHFCHHLRHILLFGVSVCPVGHKDKEKNIFTELLLPTT